MIKLEDLNKEDEYTLHVSHTEVQGIAKEVKLDNKVSSNFYFDSKCGDKIAVQVDVCDLAFTPENYGKTWWLVKD
jgi:hypothetical protein